MDVFKLPSPVSFTLTSFAESEEEEVRRRRRRKSQMALGSLEEEFKRSTNVLSLGPFVSCDVMYTR